MTVVAVMSGAWMWTRNHVDIVQWLNENTEQRPDRLMDDIHKGRCVMCSFLICAPGSVWRGLIHVR